MQIYGPVPLPTRSHQISRQGSRWHAGALLRRQIPQYQSCHALWPLYPADNCLRSNECKRRKIKCNGNTPCQRCGNLSLNCEYAPNCCSTGFKDSEEFKRMNDQLQSLQSQIDHLYANLDALRGRGPAIDRRQSGSQASGTDASTKISLPFVYPRFRGPTSSAFTLDVAKTTLNNMGWSTGMDTGDDGTHDNTPLTSPALRNLTLSNRSLRDPLWLLDENEVLRLCGIYEREIGECFVQ